MEAAWFIRSRQMATEFRFWLAITGYNSRDHSLSQRIYLVYAAVFFSIWGFAVLSWLSGAAASLLTGINHGAPAAAAAGLLGILLLGWWIYGLFRATLRSPIHFSEEDSYLICLAPVDRRGVALAWFPGEWIGGALPFWGIAVTFGFAQMDILRAGHTTLADIPIYVMAGLRALLVVLPFQAGLLALVWAVGAYRLQPGHEGTRLRLAATLLAAAGLLILVGTKIPGAAAAANGLGIALIFPLMAGFGSLAFLPGLVAGLILCAVGVIALRLVSAEMSLDRAARESAGVERASVLSILGRTDLGAQTRDQQRLSSISRAARLPQRSGSAAINWKQALRMQRLFSLGDMFPWVLLAASILAGAALPGWGPRVWGVVVWVLVGGQQACAALRRDLTQWWLFRQLPFSSRRLLLSEIAPAVLLTTGITWLCMAISGWLPAEVRLAVCLVAPGAAAAAALAAAWDVIRQAKTGQLIAGIVPEEGALGVVIGLIGPGLALLLISRYAGQVTSGWLDGAAGLSVCLFLAYFLMDLAGDALRKTG
jgi:hypothetical protein